MALFDFLKGIEISVLECDECKIHCPVAPVIFSDNGCWCIVGQIEMMKKAIKIHGWNICLNTDKLLCPRCSKN